MPTAVERSIEFLTWLHGASDSTFIYIFAAKGLKGQPGYDARYLYAKNPVELDTVAWEEQIRPKFNLWHCTNRVSAKPKFEGSTENAAANGAKYATALPALYFDLDILKEFFDPRTGANLVSGDEYYGDVRIQEDQVSAWVRSSEHGIQGYFKLAKPIAIDGSKEAFNEKVRPLLLDIAWHYGGDLKVCDVGRLMRLPGSRNKKAEYATKYEVTAEIFPERVHTFKELRERFKGDFDACPRVIYYALLKLFQEVWLKNERHGPALAIAASVRQAGLDKASCKRLFKEFTKALGDSDNRFGDVDTTYDHDVEGLATCKSEKMPIAEALDSVLKAWVDLKQKYAKATGNDWQPEERDPTDDSLKANGDRTFYERNGRTYFRNDDGEQEAANFTLKIVRRIVKFTDKSTVALAVITKGNAPPNLIEMTAAAHSSWVRFTSISGVPTGVGFLSPNLWTHYIVQIDSEAEDVPTVYETPFYGIIDGKDVFLPGDESDKYVWDTEMREHDPMEPGALAREVASPKDYLEGLATYLPNYHDATYWIPVLGWFCACPLTALFRAAPKAEGFPTLLITGQKGSGKSTLVTQVVSNHFGCKEPRSGAKGTTTTFAIKRGLGATNVGAYVLDEFRDDDDVKTGALQGFIRSLWNGYSTQSGMASGGVRTDHFITPLCIIGESPYTEAATLDRTLSVRVSPKWVREMASKDRGPYEEAQEWLHDRRLSGVLGTLLINHVKAHMADMPALIDEALEWSVRTCPINNDRKRKGFAAAYAGFLLLKRVYAEFGVDFFLAKKEIREGIYGADSEVMEEVDADDSMVRQLFKITDEAIVDGIRRRLPHKGTLYEILPHEPDVAYFQGSRWFELVGSNVRGSASASLKNERGFRDLVQDSMASDRPAITEIGSRVFRFDSLRVDLKVVAEKYRIDVDAWKDRQEDMD